MHQKLAHTTTVLCILDGVGLNPNSRGNAVAQAKKPNFEALWESVPHSTLVTYGERVGLPAGQMGNSEVGHLNIGAGRVVEQWLLRIGRALQGEFLNGSEPFQRFSENSKSSKALHIIGLFSDGGVHSHSQHLELLMKRLPRRAGQRIFLHLISDGRDTSPTRFKDQLSELLAAGLPEGVSIKSMCGRFFAMDRDKRWERVSKAYDAIVRAAPLNATDPIKYVSDSYAAGITDEFLEPVSLDPTPVDPEDSVLFWNFREDRMRELVRTLCVKDFDSFERKQVPFAPERVLGFTDYDHSFHLPFLFEQLEIKNHLGEVLSNLGIAQLRVAETEKYPHVTYFFNGGIEKEYPAEVREIVPSPRDVKTYDLKPEMSADPVCDIVIKAIESSKYGLIVVNFANGDMVGHTGVLEAGIRAVETVDACLGRIMQALGDSGQLVVIADHGNCEYMTNYEDGSPNTAHSTFPVPVMVKSPKSGLRLRDGGALCDIAPTILQLMDIPKPKEMTGESLLVSA